MIEKPFAHRAITHRNIALLHPGFHNMLKDRASLVSLAVALVDVDLVQRDATAAASSPRLNKQVTCVNFGSVGHTQV